MLLHFSLLLKASFIFGLAFVFAGLEVEAEGKYGWGEKMPTWYRTSGLAGWLYGKILGGRPLTGYHSYMFMAPLFIFHIQFFTGLEWNVCRELESIALYFCFCPLWDYIWFLLNPNYGFSRFRRENIWWHSKEAWVANRLPIGYFSLWGLSMAIATVESLIIRNQDPLFNHLFLLFFLICLTAVTIIFSPIYHKWYWTIRKTDDRDKAGIFHSEPERKQGEK